MADAYDLSGVHCVVMGSGHFTPALVKLKRETNFSVSDWIKEQHEYWRKKLIDKKKDVDYYKIFSNNPEFDYDQHYDYRDIPLGKYNNDEEKMRFTLRRKQFISDFFGINESKVIIVDHEYASLFRDEKMLPVKDMEIIQMRQCLFMGTMLSKKLLL